MDPTGASDIFLNILQVIGTVAFAISGALVAGKRKMDWFGVVVLAVMVAVGGGSLRDMLLGGYARVLGTEVPGLSFWLA